MKALGLFSKPPPGGRGTQLGLLCACGRRPIELKGLRCCRLCYYRQYDSLRWFGGLRELILKRDRFECRACGEARRLVVYHREHSATRNPFSLRCAFVATFACIILAAFANGCRKLCSSFGVS